MMSPHSHWQLSRTKAERRLVKRAAQLVTFTGLACMVLGAAVLPALRAQLGETGGTAAAWAIAGALVTAVSVSLIRFDPWPER